MSRCKRRVRAVAFDPGARFGFAWVASPDGLPSWALAITNSAVPHAHTPHSEYTGTWNLSTQADPGARYDYLFHLLAGFQPDVVLWETAPGLKGQALRWHLGYMAIAQQWAHLEKAKFIGVRHNEVKHWVCGKWNARKWEVHQVARTLPDRFGPVPEAMGPDALDAYLLLRWWWETKRQGSDRPAGTPTAGSGTPDEPSPAAGRIPPAVPC